MLKLVSIKTSPRFSSKAYLLFSDQSSFPLDLKILNQLGLKNGQQVYPTLYANISIASLLSSLKNYALRQIAISAKSQKQIKDKLKNYLIRLIKKYKIKNIDDQDHLIEQTLTFLNQKNLLRQSDFIDSIIRRHPNKSASYLRSLLKHHQIDPQLLPSEIASADHQIEIIKNLIVKKYKRYDLADPSQKNKLISALARRAFSYSDIKQAIDDLQKFS